MAEVITSTSPDIHAGYKVVTESASGAIGITRGIAMITLAGIAAMTLALPTAGVDDGKELTVVSTTANAHTITTPAAGINGVYHVYTYAGFVGNSVTFKAYNGGWWVSVSSSATAASGGGVLS